MRKKRDIFFNVDYILNGGLLLYKASEIHKGEFDLSKFDDINGVASGKFLV